jgi:uncharacterized protein involved in exopolysaccharide biosynthesis
MELLELLRTLARHRLMISLLCLSAALNTLLLTYMVTERYEATTLVLVTPEEKLKFTPRAETKESLDFPVPQIVPFEVMSLTIAELIKSRAVLGEVVSRLGLGREPTTLSWWKRLKRRAVKVAADAWAILKYGRIEEGDPAREAAEKIQRHISVSPTKDTYVFEIRYLAPSPDVAAAVVNTAAEVFVAYHRDIYRSKARLTREFIGDQLRDSEGKLATALEFLQRFKEKHKTLLLDEELSAKISALAQARISLDGTREDIAGARAEVDELRRQLEPWTVSAEVRDDVTRSLILAEGRVSSLEASRVELVSTIEGYEAKLARLPSEQLQLARLELDLALAEETHRFITQAYDEARIGEAKQVQEIKVISPAVPAVYPIRPIKVTYVGMATAMALAIGICIAFFLEYVDITLRGVAAAERALELPLLATVPTMDWQRVSRRRRSPNA